MKQKVAGSIPVYHPMKNNQVQTLKGFRDFLPKDMAVRNYLKNLFIEVFEQFGFEPLKTPTLEYASVLTGKYGDQADKLVYTFKDKGNRKVGLRYDLTVPTSRVLATNPNLPLPFKRYQIQPVWRADKPQRGRYREFIQSDIDIFGSSSPTTDAEILAVIYQVLLKLNFKKYSIRVNSRQVLKQILDQINLSDQQNTVLQSLDKFDKIGPDGVTKELVDKGLSSQTINQLFDYIKVAQPDDYLKQVIDQAKALGVNQKVIVFDPTLVRGLDYYTGPIFETYVDSPKVGSITGGGRYDGLVKQLGGPDIPAVGTSLGFDRIVDCINSLDLLPNLAKSKTKVLVANFDQNLTSQTLGLASDLRSAGINTAIYPDKDKIGKQIKYAESLNIPYLAILGQNEVDQGKITLKNLVTRDQKLVNLDELLKIIKKNL